MPCDITSLLTTSENVLIDSFNVPGVGLGLKRPVELVLRTLRDQRISSPPEPLSWS